MREAAIAEEALGRLVDGGLRKSEHVVVVAVVVVVGFARLQAAVGRAQVVQDPSTCPMEISRSEIVESGLRRSKVS